MWTPECPTSCKRETCLRMGTNCSPPGKVEPLDTSGLARAFIFSRSLIVRRDLLEGDLGLTKSKEHMLRGHQPIDVCVKKRVCVVGKLPRIGGVLFNWSFFAAFMKITVMDNGQIPQERLQDSPTTCRCHPIDPLPLMGRRPSTKQKLKDSPLWINGNGFCCWFRLYHEYRNQPTKPWNMGITNPYPAWHIWVLWWFGSRCLECYDTIQAIELLMEMRKWYPNGTHTFLGSVGNTNTYNI